jgi:hypothetical protein
VTQKSKPREPASHASFSDTLPDFSLPEADTTTRSAAPALERRPDAGEPETDTSISTEEGQLARPPDGTLASRYASERLPTATVEKTATVARDTIDALPEDVSATLVPSAASATASRGLPAVAPPRGARPIVYGAAFVSFAAALTVVAMTPRGDPTPFAIESVDWPPADLQLAPPPAPGLSYSSILEVLPEWLAPEPAAQVKRRPAGAAPSLASPPESASGLADPPPAAPVNPTAPARLRVVVRRAGSPVPADVNVDGTPSGEAPLILDLASGIHELEIRAAGSPVVRRQVHLPTGGSERVIIDLDGAVSP